MWVAGARAMAWLPALGQAARSALLATVCAATVSCGGGGGGGLSAGTGAVGQSSSSSGDTSSNVTSVIADAGPGSRSVNTLFTSVTVCVPGTSTCQTIDHIQVDTASFGLRILAPALTLTLPVQSAANGNALVECMVFADGYSWGPVVAADVSIAGETAASVPVQVIGDARYPTVPSDCSGAGPTEEDTVATFGANGILGIGVFIQDCGTQCANVAQSAAYYACSQASCSATTVPLAAQVTNPVALFATDNNGTIVELPSVAAQGASSLTGSLVFGVDTEANNALGNATVLTLDPNYGYLQATFDGQTLRQAFVDTGSNANYFNDSAIAQCTNSNLSGFYCPAATLSLSAMLTGNNGITASVAFSVGNAQTLRTTHPSFAVVPELAGNLSISGAFDFGLPFFYGRRVATVLESRPTSAGDGPYIAF